VVEILGDFVTLVLAAVILAAALIKASRFWSFVSVVRTWGLGNPVVARSTARALIATELLFGTAAVATTVASAGEALARLSLLALLVGLGVGQVVIRVRARGAECGCFGSPSRVGARSLIRVWALAGVAVLCLGGPAITSSMAQSGSPSWAYPAGTTTGVASVDAAIAAATSGSADALRKALHFTSVACSTSPGLGGVPCPDGTADGTPVDIVMAGSCELAGVTAASPALDDVLAQAARPNLFLYAVAHVTPDPASPVPSPEYLVFLGSGDDPGVAGGSTSYAPVVLGVTGDGVVQVVGGCAASVADMAGRPGLDDWLLPPRAAAPSSTATQAPPTAPAAGTGTPGTGSNNNLPIFAAVAALAVLALGGAYLVRRR
jgi:hypothetical protein